VQARVEVASDRKDLLVAGRRSSREWVRTLNRFRHHPSGMLGGVILVVMITVVVLAPYLAPYNPLDTDPLHSRVLFSPAHPLGTDILGRDLLSRILYGGRVSLVLGVIAVAIGGIVGSVLGLISGYFRGYLDTIIMQLNDILLTLPSFLLALGAVAVLGTGIYNVMIAVGISFIPNFARVVRGSTLTAREADYVVAARVVGVGSGRIMFRHVLPNVLAPIMVLATVGVAGAILVAASLSFIGLGAQPPRPERGLMVNEGRTYLRLAWWISTYPGVAIMVAVIAINLVGDALRDIFDPRLRGR
jgi:peptide/nickel transport system permease protein